MQNLKELASITCMKIDGYLYPCADTSCYMVTFAFPQDLVCTTSCSLYRLCVNFFALLPICNFFYFFSTGLSPDLQSMEQVRRILRPTDVPDQGLLCDLLWSDPDKDVLGWGENDRGVSFTFGADVVAKFLHKHDLDLICRAHQVWRESCCLNSNDAHGGQSHFSFGLQKINILPEVVLVLHLYFLLTPLLLSLQVVEDGYEFFAKRQLVTLFSAPNYCGEFDNAGSMMSVDESLMCSFQVSPLPHNCSLFPYKSH